MHAYEAHAYEMHVYEVHAHNMHAVRYIHAYEMHVYEVRARKMHACEVYAHKMTPIPCTVDTSSSLGRIYLPGQPHLKFRG
jgi:hypothetical protein